MDQYAKAIFDMHEKSGIAEAIQKIKPMDKNALGVDQYITEWGPACIQRIASIRSKLRPGETPGHDTILHAIDSVE